MQREILDPQLLTFMYFMRSVTEKNLLEPHGLNRRMEDFFDEWTEVFYKFDDLINGREYD